VAGEAKVCKIVAGTATICPGGSFRVQGGSWGSTARSSNRVQEGDAIVREGVRRSSGRFKERKDRQSISCKEVD